MVPRTTPSASGSSAAPSIPSAAPIAPTAPTNPSSQASGSALPRTSDVWIQTADGQRFALRSFLQSVVSEGVPDRAGRLSSIPFRVKALPIAGEGVSWRSVFGVGVRPRRAHLARNTYRGYWREAGLACFVFAASGGRGALGSLPSSSVRSGRERRACVCLPSCRSPSEAQWSPHKRMASATANPATAGQPDPRECCCCLAREWRRL